MKDDKQSNFRMNKIHLPNSEKTELALLSPERAQKLNLLIHLVTNLTESLVVCGPVGIGKTTLLEALKGCDKGLLPILSIEASRSLTLEGFKEQLSRLLLKQLSVNVEDKSISSILTELDRKNKKIVILIDNSGQLTAGLIGTLIEYAGENLGLRLVFSLSRDELHVIKEFDDRVDECHFIDIPALTEEQCGVFLRKLSNDPDVDLSPEVIDAQLIERIYVQTHGIPGKIISQVSTGNYSSRWEYIERYKWFGLAAISLLVILGGFFISKDSVSESNQVETGLPVAAISVDEFEDIVMKAPLQVLEEKENLSQKLDGKNYFETDLAVGSINQTSYSTDKQSLAVVEKNIKTIKTALPSTKTIIDSRMKKAERFESKNSDDQWVLKQPKEYRTIQLAVLSKKSAVDSLFDKHPNLKNDLKFFKKAQQENPQYVVVYGSFKDTATAVSKVKSLPAQYKKSWVRSFSDLHKIIKK